MDYQEKIDYSSLSTYQVCPRKFLFQYIMNLRSPYKSIHLVFGACWHYGLEVVYKAIKSGEQLTELEATIMSTKAFNLLWKIEGAPHFPDEDIIFPKSPGHAANMYKKYWERFLHSDSRKTIIDVEAPFVINLNTYALNLPNYIGRLDLIFADNLGNPIIVDHKTTKAIYQTTVTGFEASYQTDGYLAAGRIYYEKIPSMVYRVALCQKSKIAFENYTINKRVMAIEHFLHDLVYFTKEIITNLDILNDDIIRCTERNDILNSFPRCSGYSCTTYMSNCSYYDLCRLRNNPLLWLHKPPQGFIYDEWDPDLHEEKMRRKLAEVM